MCEAREVLYVGEFMAMTLDWLFGTEQLRLMSLVGFVLVSGVALYLMWNELRLKSQTVLDLDLKSQALNLELQQAQQAYTNLNTQYQQTQQRKDHLDKELQELEVQYHLSQKQLTDTQANQLSVVRELAEYREQIAELTTASKLQKQHHQEQLEQMKSARDRFSAEFQTLADRLLHEKAQSFDKQQRSGLEKVLAPLHEQLGGFKKHVDHMYESELRDRASLRAELDLLKSLNQQMSSDAINLTKALTGEQKTQGTWGEVILERVLERSGLRKNFEYRVQAVYRSPEGKRLIPDVVIDMPDNRQVIVDAKVSLTAYERACQQTANQESYEQAIKAHITSVKNHISQLSSKSYEQIEGVSTLEFVLLFLPIDAAYLAALHADHSLFEYAYQRNIILTCPTTLLSALKTIDAMWKQQRQNQNVKAIVKQSGLLHDQCCLVLESLQELGEQIEKTQDSYGKVLERLAYGRGNVIKRIDNLRELGAQSKKQIPSVFQPFTKLDSYSANGQEAKLIKTQLSNNNTATLRAEPDTLLKSLSVDTCDTEE